MFFWRGAAMVCHFALKSWGQGLFDLSSGTMATHLPAQYWIPASTQRGSDGHLDLAGIQPCLNPQGQFPLNLGRGYLENHEQSLNDPCKYTKCSEVFKKAFQCHKMYKWMHFSLRKKKVHVFIKIKSIIRKLYTINSNCRNILPVLFLASQYFWMGVCLFIVE